MRMIKYFMSIVMVVLFWTVIYVPAAQAADNSPGCHNFSQVNTYQCGQFNDVPQKAWFTDYVASAYEMGLMKGSELNHFDVSGKVSLAETITMAARVHSIYTTGNGKFNQGSPWYQVYVDYALAHNIIEQGYPDYNADATRAQFATIFAYALPNDALSPINSVADGSIPDLSLDAACSDEVYKLYRAGILTGNDDLGTFTPNSSINRNAAAAIVTRMADTSLRKTITLNNQVAAYAYPDNSNITDAYAQEVIRLVNIERTKAGLGALVTDATLCKATKIRVSEIQISFSHTRPNGDRCLSVINEVGLSYAYAGENIAIGYTSPDLVVQAWMDSPGHRANILNPNFGKIGVSALANTQGKYQGYAWAQIFTN